MKIAPFHPHNLRFEKKSVVLQNPFFGTNLRTPYSAYIEGPKNSP